MANHTTIKTYPVDTTLFSANQLHTKSILSIAMNNSWEWFAKLGLSFPSFINEYKQGLVVSAIDVNYLEPFKFRDSANIEIHTKPARIFRSGLQLGFTFDFFAQKKHIINLDSISTVLRLSGDDALGGSPRPLQPALLSLFPKEHINKESKARSLLPILNQMQNRLVLIEYTHPFIVHRHQCEVADQWSVIETANWVSEAREHALLQSKDLNLRKILNKPMKRFIAEFSRPMFFTDKGEVRSKAYNIEEKFFFIHEILNLTQNTRPAIIVEEF